MDAARSIGNRAFALDASAVLVASALIAFVADRLLLMSVAVPIVIALRMVGFAMLPKAERGSGFGAEVLLMAVCTLLGAFNDWNSVHNHRIYDYSVPVYFPAISIIPIWMLLLWGLILRFFLTLASWSKIGASALRDDVWLGPKRVRSGGMKVVVQLALVLATRQAIYRLYDDPWWSWLPFALAIAIYAAMTRPSVPQWKLFGLALVVGPIVEAIYIQVGHLHRYHLGWIGGVPLWIALWWPLAVLVWVDLAGRLVRVVHRS